MAFTGDERETLLYGLESVAMHSEFGRWLNLRTTEVYAPFHAEAAGDVSVGNIRANDGDEPLHQPPAPFLIALHARSAVRSAGEADAFFAAATDAAAAPARPQPRPVLMVFATRDEAVMGRTCTVQAGSSAIAITIADARLAARDLVEVVGRLGEPMQRFDDMVTEMADYADAARVRDVAAAAMFPATTRTHLLDIGLRSTTARALGHARDLVVERARRVVEDVVWRLQCTAHHSAALPPDMAVLTAACRGPVVVHPTADLPPGVLGAAEFAAGDAALIVSACECGEPARAAWAIVSTCQRFAAARVVVIAAAADAESHDAPAEVSIGMRVCQECTPAIVVETRGVSVTRVAHLCECVYGAALDARRAIMEHAEWNLCDEIENMLVPAGSSASELAVAALRAQRVHAHAVIARYVRTGLADIKARLWHPSGRLARRMVAAGCGEGQSGEGQSGEGQSAS